MALNNNHPNCGHRPRTDDRTCFRIILVRLVTGCSWVDVGRLCGKIVSDTTARERHHEWIAAGVFDTVAAHAITAIDRIIGLDLDNIAVDGSIHKRPAAGK